jgi:hypothetical protein
MEYFSLVDHEAKIKNINVGLFAARSKEREFDMFRE